VQDLTDDAPEVGRGVGFEQLRYTVLATGRTPGLSRHESKSHASRTIRPAWVLQATRARA
jgi:hypothetical protein